jgi:hypothetical protein
MTDVARQPGFCSRGRKRRTSAGKNATVNLVKLLMGRAGAVAQAAQPVRSPENAAPTGRLSSLPLRSKGSLRHATKPPPPGRALRQAGIAQPLMTLMSRPLKMHNILFINILHNFILARIAGK